MKKKRRKVRTSNAKRFLLFGIVAFLCFALPAFGFMLKQHRLAIENKVQAEAIAVPAATTTVYDTKRELDLEAALDAYEDKVTMSQAQRVLPLIAQCESGNDPLAKNKTSTAKGLLQILDPTWRSFSCVGNVYDADDNFRCGVKIATRSGLNHWDSSKSCWAKKYIEEEMAQNT